MFNNMFMAFKPFMQPQKPIDPIQQQPVMPQPSPMANPFTSIANSVPQQPYGGIPQQQMVNNPQPMTNTLGMNPFLMYRGLPTQPQMMNPQANQMFGSSGIFAGNPFFRRF